MNKIKPYYIRKIHPTSGRVHRFQDELKGNRGEAARCGTKKSGIHAHIRSYDNDVYSDLRADEKGKDVLSVTIPEGLITFINGMEFTDLLKALENPKVKEFIKEQKIIEAI